MWHAWSASAWVTKLDGFAATLEPNEQALLQAVLVSPGENDVQAFGIDPLNFGLDPLGLRPWPGARDLLDGGILSSGHTTSSNFANSGALGQTRVAGEADRG